MDQQRFDACMKQADFSIKRFDERRNYEWKVSISFWAIILASIKVLQGKTLPYWVGPVIVAGYAFLWLRGIWIANFDDKEMAFHFREHAEQILRNPNHVVPSSPKRTELWTWRWWFGFLKDWASLFQLFATMVLIILAYTFIK